MANQRSKGKTGFMIYIPRELKEQVKELARLDGLSVTAWTVKKFEESLRDDPALDTAKDAPLPASPRKPRKKKPAPPKA